MEIASILLAIVCYGLAAYAWRRFQSPIFMIALLSGHLGALTIPLWSWLYGISYRADLSVAATFMGQPLTWFVLIASAWLYALPALLTLALYQTHWWFPGYITGALTYAAFLIYHMLVEGLGLRTQTWSYRVAGLPFGVSNALLTALIAALVSLALLYALLAVRHYAWPSLLMTLLPATFLILLLVRGLLGAPLWIVLMLDGRTWALQIGALSALALLLWGVHIVISGLRRMNRSGVI